MATYTSFELANWDKYDFVLNSYNGTGGYITGNYLFPHTRELDFESRRKQAYYKNYVQGVLDSVISPVFSQDAIRSSENEIFNEFIKNCDNAETTLQKFSKKATTMARLLGTVFVVMDNFTETASTQKEAIDNRLFPYIYMKLPQDVYKHTVDKYGNLKSITFFMDENDDGDYEYMYWDTDNYHRYVVVNGKTKTISEGKHGLGVLPVVTINTTETEGYLVQPPFYDLSRLNLTIYNQDSEQRDLERIQSFSVLVVPGTQPDQNIEIGSHNLIYIDNDATQSPKYISPDPQVLTTLRTSSEHNIDALITMANILGATAINNGNSTKSGVAMSFEFLGQSYQLMETAMYATEFEEAIAKLFGLFIGQEIGYTVVYKTDYIPTATQVKAKLDILQTISESFSEYVTPEQKEDISNSISGMLKYATSV